MEDEDFSELHSFLPEAVTSENTIASTKIRADREGGDKEPTSVLPPSVKSLRAGLRKKTH